MKESEVLEPEVDKEVEHAIDELINPTKAIILYNDDYNSFDWVIECLQKYCKHGYEQSGQITLIVHNTGKCDIKHGSYDQLKPVYEALLDAKLSVKIEN